MTGLCFAVAAIVRAVLPVDAFTLAWTHSIEKVRWEEDYRTAGRGLTATAARVRGSGAGMEPPPGAVLRDGVFHYRPEAARVERLRLTVSPYTADYAVCWRGRCAPLSPLVGMQGETGVVEVSACAYFGVTPPATSSPQALPAMPSSFAGAPRPNVASRGDAR